MKITELKINPENPRIIKDEKFLKLKKSIQEFPKMMELRPIIYDPETKFILGGNMRFKAIKDLGYKDIPSNWIKSTKELTKEEKKRFIIEDNVSFGEWDLDNLLKWDQNELINWGLDLPELNEQQKSELIELKEYKRVHILISCPPDLLYLIEKQLDAIQLIPEIEYEQSAN